MHTTHKWSICDSWLYSYEVGDFWTKVLNYPHAIDDAHAE